MTRYGISQEQAVRLRKQCDGRYRWASISSPWRFCGGTGKRRFVLKPKARKATR